MSTMAFSYSKKRTTVKGNDRPPHAFSLSSFLHHKDFSKQSCVLRIEYHETPRRASQKEASKGLQKLFDFFSEDSYVLALNF